MKKLMFIGAAGALALSTGCTAVMGGMAGGTLFGDGHAPWDQANVATLGQAVVCLGSDQAVTPSQSYEFSGEIVGMGFPEDGDQANQFGFDNLIPCWQQPSSTITVRDDDGVNWTVGYAWLDQGGWDNTPWIDIGQGAEVSITVAQGEGESAGFALYQSDRLTYAMESGRNGQAGIDAYIDGMEVTVEDEVGTVSTPCGDRTALSVAWSTDFDKLTLFPDEDGAVLFNSERYTACNITSYSMDEDGSCEDDPSTDVSWVVFDRPPNSTD